MTDFEILLRLWKSGLRIESFIAIDTAYGHRSQYDPALDALAIFFAPCRTFSFASGAKYAEAAGRQPALFGGANLFIYCDAAAVPTELFKEAASAALLPGFCAFELSNSGGRHGERPPPLEYLLPPKLQALNAYGGLGGSSMAILRKLPEGARGFERHPLEHVDDEMLDWPSGHSRSAHVDDAVKWLEANARARAAEHNMRLFRVVHAKRMPVRSSPSREASLVGVRRPGDEIIAETVQPDGWVRLSPEADTYAGFQHYDSAQEMWMLRHADDVGELLREVVLDGRGEDIDDDDWLPDLV